MVPATPLLVYLDSCLLITLGNAGELGLMLGNPRLTVLVGPRTLGEVVRPPASEAVSRALEAGTLRRDTLDLYDAAEAGELARFDAMPAFRGRGDAEVLALASCRGGCVGSDDRAVRRVAAGLLGATRVVGTLDLLVWNVRDGRLDLAEAEALLDRVDVGPGIRDRLAAAQRGLADLV